MKKNKAKYIVILVLICIAICVGWYFSSKKENIEENKTNVSKEETKTENYNLRLGISNLDTLNPLISKNKNIQDISKLIYEPLLDISDTFKLEKALATEVSKADSKAYLVKLRENVKWHNGGDFSADDVKFTIDTIKSLGEKSIYILNVSNIETVEVLSGNLIRLNLNEEIPFFEYNLTFPIISKELFAGDNIENSDKNNVPMGTGKYKLKTIDSSQMDLEKNATWWNSENTNLRIDEIDVRIYRSISEVYNSYKLGGIDMISTKTLNIEDTIRNYRTSYRRRI